MKCLNVRARVEHFYLFLISSLLHFYLNFVLVASCSFWSFDVQSDFNLRFTFLPYKYLWLFQCFYDQIELKFHLNKVVLKAKLIWDFISVMKVAKNYLTLVFQTLNLPNGFRTLNANKKSIVVDYCAF